MIQQVYLILIFVFLWSPMAWARESPAEKEKPPVERELRERIPESRLKRRMDEGLRLMREKKWEDAIRLFEEMAQQLPRQEEIYFYLGVSYMELGRVQKAEEVLKKALRLNPNYVAAYFELAEVYERTLQLQESLETYDRIIQVDPFGEAGRIALFRRNIVQGILLARSQDFDGALRLFQSAAEIDPDNPDAHYQIGRVYRRINEEVKAEEAFRKVVTLNPQYQPAYLELGDLYQHQTRFQEALDAYINAAQINPNTPGGRNAQAKIPFLQGNLLAQSGKMEEALKAYQQALRITPDPAPIYFSIAQVYLAKGDLENAEAALVRTLEVDPKNQGALLKIGILYEQQGKLEEALRAYENARDVQPRSRDGIDAAVSAHTVRGKIAIQAENLDQALEEFKQALELQPKNAANHFNLALLHLRRNELAEAAAAFDRVIELDPSETDAYLPLADILEKSGREQEAIETYERLIALGEEPLASRAKVRLHLLKGVIFGSRLQYEEARAEFEEAVRLDPQDRTGYVYLGLAQMKAKDPYAAVDTFKKVLEIDPSNRAVRLRLAGLYEELGRPYDALDLYQGVLQEEGVDAPTVEEIEERINVLFGTIAFVYQVTYDSNINLSEDAQSDLKTEVFSQYQRFFLFKEGWRSGFRLSPSLTMFHRDQTSVLAGQAGLFADWRRLQKGVSLGYNFRLGVFEGSLSDRSHELLLDGFMPVGESSTLSGSLRFRYSNSVDNDFDTVDSDIYDGFQPSISASLATDGILGGRFTMAAALYGNVNTQEVDNVSTQGADEANQPTADDQAYIGFSPSIAFDRPIIQGIILNLAYNYSYQSYLHPDSELQEKRIVHGHGMSAGVTVGLERGLYLYLRGSLSANRSRQPGIPPERRTAVSAEKVNSLSEYTKWLTTFGIRLLF